MLIGNMNEVEVNFSEYPEAIREALEFLRTHDFKTMEDGKYPIHGEDSYAILQRYYTKAPKSSKPEAHRRYVDIQYIVEGREQIGWCPLNPELEVYAPYDEEKDIIFYDELIPGTGLILGVGEFAILYPKDVHKPCGSLGHGPEKVTKVVVKIAVDYIK